MTTNTQARSRRRRWIAGVVALAVVALIGGLMWVLLNGYTTREQVEVVDAEYLPGQQALLLIVGTCQGNPELTQLEQTDSEVRVAVVSTIHHFQGGNACQDSVEVALEEPLAQRQVIDLASGTTVSVLRNVPTPTS